MIKLKGRRIRIKQYHSFIDGYLFFDRSNHDADNPECLWPMPLATSRLPIFWDFRSESVSRATPVFAVHAIKHSHN
jgi:hypothetical protein